MIAAAVLLTTLLYTPYANEVGPGLVVEEVTPGGGGDIAGIEEGDLLLTWSAGDERKESQPTRLESPFALWDVDGSKVPLGDTRLQGKRGKKTTTYQVPPSKTLEISVRPHFSGSKLDKYMTSKSAIDARDFARGAQGYHELANCLVNDETTTPVGVWMLEKVGQVYARADQWQEVAKTFEEARSHASNLRDKSIQASLLERQGELYGHYEKFLEAKEVYQQAADLRRQLTPDLSLSRTFSSLGKMAYTPGDFQQAYHFYQESLDIHSLYAPETLSYARLLNEMGHAAMQSGAEQEAESCFKKAFEIAFRNDPSGPEYFDALRALGDLAGLHGEGDRAQLLLGQAQQLSEQFGPISIYQVKTLKSLGDTANAAGLPRRAFDFYSEAEILISRLSPRSIEHAELLVREGEALWQMRMYGEARPRLERALGIIEEKAPQKPLHARALQALGNNYRDQGKPKKALNIYRLTREAIESFTSFPNSLKTSQEQQLVFSSRYRAYYRDHMDLLLDQGRTREAFEVSEQYRARTLLAALGQARQVQDENYEDLQRVRKELEDLRQQLRFRLPSRDDSIDHAPQQAQLAKLSRLKERERDLIQSIEHCSGYVPPVPLRHDEIVATLDPDMALLSFMVHDDNTYVIALSSTYGTHAEVIGIGQEELSQKVDDLRRYMMSPGSSTATQRLSTLSNQLGNLLLGGLTETLAQHSRLVILPDGPLHHLPFSVLRTPDHNYLIESHQIHLAESATVYREMNRDSEAVSAPARLNFVGFGNPLTSSTISENEIQASQHLMSQLAQRLQASTRRSAHLKELPFSRLEVETIADQFPGPSRSFLGTQASESNFRDNARFADILHLACHGLYDDDDSLNSALVLHGNGQAEEQDGYLHAHEILDLNLKAQLIVLSACDSGLGKNRQGEGLLSMAQAFRLAGARSVMATLWRISDLSTTLFMDRFYSYLQAGHPASEALMQTQRDFIHSRPDYGGQELAHPYYWAPFQLYGDPPGRPTVRQAHDGIVKSDKKPS